jgi:hypothetical protein
MSFQILYNGSICEAIRLGCICLCLSDAMLFMNAVIFLMKAVALNGTVIFFLCFESSGINYSSRSIHADFYSFVFSTRLDSLRVFSYSFTRR